MLERRALWCCCLSTSKQYYDYINYNIIINLSHIFAHELKALNSYLSLLFDRINVVPVLINVPTETKYIGKMVYSLLRKSKVNFLSY